MKMHRSHLLFIIAALLLLSSCGGSSAASAPPIDLPAPITGRIDVSEPENGYVTITGAAGAVTGGSTVIAVNETVAGQQSLRFLDLLIRSAYAQSQFPAVCSETGKACALAEADGSFVIVLAASESDAIAIGLIDPVSGAYVSDLVRTTVPSGAGGGGTSSSACAGLGLSGQAVDVVIVPEEDTTIVLKQGSDTATNRITIGGSLYNNTVSIDGCYANTLAVMKYTDGAGNSSIILAATSSSDRALWTATYANGTVWNPTAFTLTDMPMQVTFIGNSITPIVVLQNATTPYLANVSLSDGGLTGTMDLGVANVVSVTDLDVLEMQDGKHLGLIVNQDNVNVTRFTFFYADTLTTFNSVLATALGLPGGSDTFWASFFLAQSGGTDCIALAIADSSPLGDSLVLAGFLEPLGSAGAYAWSQNIEGAEFGNGINELLWSVTISIAPKTPVDIVTAADAAQPVVPPVFNNAIVPMSDGTISAIPLTLGGMAPSPWAVGSIPDPLAAVAVSNADHEVAILDATTGDATFVSNLFTWQ